MDQNDFIAKAKALFYALRHGQTEKVLAFLVFALPTAAAFLRQQEWTGFHQAANLAFALSAASALWLVVRIWKRAAPPPEPPAGPVPSAIKGLFPFTAADGKLFAQLGRQMELQQLLGLARNDRVAISAVRGESGAGKTSLLQGGLAYVLGEEQCIYWEAVPENAPDALLHTIRSQIPEIESLESLPQACPRRCMLILDQFEQLRTEEPGHAPVFALLTRIAKAPAPYKLSSMIGFRREYAADWLDFEKDCGFRAEQVPINLLASPTAGDALVALAGEAGFTLDHALVENFITSVARAQGVLPVDVAIGVLSLANFVQQRGVTHVGMKEYSLAGGAQGLLLSFVQQKMEEIPEALRAPLLKGIVLALASPSNNQRVAAGETAVVIASRAEVPESTLSPWLERLAHPRVRLLEKLEKKAEALRYRLPHERLVPVLRRLAGATLASLDQLRLLFESEYERWRESGDRRHLLGGSDLSKILYHSDQFVQGEAAPAKIQYLAACVRRRDLLKFAIGVAVVTLAGTVYESYRLWDSSIQKQKLASWGLLPDIFQMQHEVDEICFQNTSVNDLSWLRSSHMRKLSTMFTGSSLAGLENLKGLTSLELYLSSKINSFAELEQLKELTLLTLGLRGDQIFDLMRLNQLKRLTSLTLNLQDPKVNSLAELAPLKAIPSLTIRLYGSDIASIGGAEWLKDCPSLTLEQGYPKGSRGAFKQLKGLTVLTLNLYGSDITSFADLEQLQKLTSLTLELNGSQVINLASLEQLKGLTSLTLNLEGSKIASLSGLEKLQRLAELTLVPSDSEITTLAGLELIRGLTSVTLNRYGSKLTNLTELERLPKLTSLRLYGFGLESLSVIRQLPSLTSLVLELASPRVTSLKEIELPKELISLSLDFNPSSVTNLAGLDHLKKLTSLSLGLSGSELTSLAGLERLTSVTSLSLNLDHSKVLALSQLEELKDLILLRMVLPASLVSNFSRLQIRRSIAEIWIVLDVNTPFEVPKGCRFVGIGDSVPADFWKQ